MIFRIFWDLKFVTKLTNSLSSESKADKASETREKCDIAEPCAECHIVGVLLRMFVQDYSN